MTVIPLEDAPGNGQTSWKVKQWTPAKRR